MPDRPDRSVNSASSRPQPACPRCGSNNTRRLRRETVMQRSVLSLLGLYPWSCQGCENQFNLRDRGPLRRKRRDEGERHLPTIG